MNRKKKISAIPRIIDRVRVSGVLKRHHGRRTKKKKKIRYRCQSVEPSQLVKQFTCVLFAAIVFYGIVLIRTVNGAQHHEYNCKRWRRWSCGSVRTPLSRAKTRVEGRRRKCGIRVAGRATETNWFGATRQSERFTYDTAALPLSLEPVSLPGPSRPHDDRGRGRKKRTTANVVRT